MGSLRMLWLDLAYASIAPVTLTCFRKPVTVRLCNAGKCTLFFCGVYHEPVKKNIGETTDTHTQWRPMEYVNYLGNSENVHPPHPPPALLFVFHSEY